jgi:hypothetical protein
VATATESPCPRCGAIGTLDIVVRLVVAPIGEFSLSGVMMKFPARQLPVLTCSGCGLDHVGQWDPDGRHALFTPIP